MKCDSFHVYNITSALHWSNKQNDSALLHTTTTTTKSTKTTNKANRKQKTEQIFWKIWAEKAQKTFSNICCWKFDRNAMQCDSCDSFYVCMLLLACLLLLLFFLSLWCFKYSFDSVNFQIESDLKACARNFFVWNIFFSSRFFFPCIESVNWMMFRQLSVYQKVDTSISLDIFCFFYLLLCEL